ncbi:MAG TPA: RluA family pseudouridine synthase [Opitutaceae bacterium]|nr:RluA family pseudouridine synthase [Opitutaceae bacterium]
MPTRADKILSRAFPEHSRVAFQRAFDAGLVRLRGNPVKRDASVVGGDVIEFEFPDVKPAEVRAVDIPLDVIFEDKHMLAINKPAGMVVHPGVATGEDTLVHALLSHCAGSLSGIGGVERPGIVHRLDRETSGIILVAKNDAAHRALSEQFAERSLQKEYFALVGGAPGLLSGSIRKSIGRNKQHRHKMAVVESEDGGKEAHTDWQVVERFGDLATLIRCTIHTGRTHQIRVHMKALGSVILGDVIYGWKPDSRLPKQPERVMLHAEHLVFTHPKSGKELDLRAPLPKDFEAQLTQLRKMAKAAAKAKKLIATPVKPRKKPGPPAAHIHESRK